MKAGFPLILATLVLSWAAMPGLRAQFLYSLVDTTDDVSFTYESSELITSSTVGSSTDGAFGLDFNPDYNVPTGPRGGVVHAALSGNEHQVDELNVQGESGRFQYAFPAGAFDSLGTFSSPSAGSETPDESFQQATLTITATPEPGPFVLIIIGGFVLMARQRWMQGARVKAA